MPEHTYPGHMPNSKAYTIMGIGAAVGILGLIVGARGCSKGTLDSKLNVLYGDKVIESDSTIPGTKVKITYGSQKEGNVLVYNVNLAGPSSGTGKKIVRRPFADTVKKSADTIKKAESKANYAPQPKAEPASKVETPAEAPKPEAKQEPAQPAKPQEEEGYSNPNF